MRISFIILVFAVFALLSCLALIIVGIWALVAHGKELPAWVNIPLWILIVIVALFLLSVFTVMLHRII